MKQFIICPNCGAIELAAIEPRVPARWDYHTCSKCKNILPADGWQLAKAISIKQPWAYLIASGIKDVENRTWKTKFRGRILLHAGAKLFVHGRNKNIFTEDHNISIKNHAFILNDLTWRYADAVDWPFSAIIGSVEIVDCIQDHPSIWAERGAINKYIDGNLEKTTFIWNWVLKNPIMFEKPILNVKGKLSFFTPEIPD